jgi:2-polyprenyl-3-methyl-5-hydroxy-6-metoxy-1,4-benzoquinol methylase
MPYMSCVVCSSSNIRIRFARGSGHIGTCMRCGLVQQVPMLTMKEIASLYHEDFDHFTPYLAQLDVHRAYFREKIRQIGCKIYDLRLKRKRKLFLHPKSYLLNLRLLDIGCAMGVLLEEAVSQGIDAVGIDISADAVTYCKKQGLSVIHGTIQSAGKKLQPASYDVVTAFQVIEHEPDPVAFVTRIHSVLKNGGLAIFATPDHGGFWRKIMGKRWVGFMHPEHVVLFDPTSMLFLLKKTGFRDIHISRDTARPFPLSFAFSRASDYFPWVAWLLRPLGKLIDRLGLRNPINPWDDMIVFARKEA